MSVSLTAESVIVTVMTCCSFTWSSWSLMESACDYVNTALFSGKIILI